MLLIPSARNLILANEDGDVSISFVTRTRDLWRCTNMEDKRRDIRVGDMWQDYHEGWDTGTIGQPDMCQNLSETSQSKSHPCWVNQRGSKELVVLFMDDVFLIGTDSICCSELVMDWLLVSCNKQRYQGDRCGLVTIKIQKLYWSHYSQNTSVLARQRLLTRWWCYLNWVLTAIYLLRDLDSQN